MNPHMIWLEGGRKFACTFCGTVTATPHDYIENVGPDGRRRDADRRPELSCGSYEFVAGPQFQVPFSKGWHVLAFEIVRAPVWNGCVLPSVNVPD